MKSFLYDVARGTAVALSVGLVLHVAKRYAVAYGLKIPASYNPSLPATYWSTSPATVSDMVGSALAALPSTTARVEPVSGVPTASASHDTETRLSRERA